MKGFKLPKVKNILKSPKMKLPKVEWEKEYEDKVELMCGKIGTCGIYLSLEKGNIWELINKYIGNESKVKIKVRKGAILIERIK